LEVKDEVRKAIPHLNRKKERGGGVCSARGHKGRKGVKIQLTIKKGKSNKGDGHDFRPKGGMRAQ